MHQMSGNVAGSGRMRGANEGRQDQDVGICDDCAGSRPGIEAERRADLVAGL